MPHEARFPPRGIAVENNDPPKGEMAMAKPPDQPPSYRCRRLRPPCPSRARASPPSPLLASKPWLCGVAARDLASVNKKTDPNHPTRESTIPRRHRILSPFPSPYANGSPCSHRGRTRASNDAAGATGGGVWSQKMPAKDFLGVVAAPGGLRSPHPSPGSWKRPKK